MSVSPLSSLAHANLPADPDVVVIGAGAAGVAAGRELRRLGLTPLILEARDRVGGRAWSDDRWEGAPLDLGCEWLHSADRNILVDLAESMGRVIDRSDPPWMRPAKQMDHSEADRRGFEAAYQAFEDRLAEAAEQAEHTGVDLAASALLEKGSPWNARLDLIASFYHGAYLDHVSVVDYGRYVDTGLNWRVEGGYGSLIAASAADLPLALDCAVRAVDATGRRIRVETDRGTIECGAVIVTIPTNVLASGAIRFTPALDDHRQAASVLPLGVADKLYFALDVKGDFEDDTRVTGPWDRRDIGTYTLLPGGRLMIEGYFGGDHARSLEQGGLEAFASAGREDLTRVFGSDFARRLTPLVATGWARDPLSLGSYSHALPGHADARAILATPAAERIFFAGEAASRRFFSTAHGAFETGIEAARDVAAMFEGRGKAT